MGWNEKTEFSYASLEKVGRVVLKSLLFQILCYLMQELKKHRRVSPTRNEIFLFLKKTQDHSVLYDPPNLCLPQKRDKLCTNFSEKMT